MKFIQTKETVYSSNETKQLTMAVNAKAFEIVSGKLYKNIIRAVIREYSTNAVDSHKEAGNPDPIEVHLPTHSEPYFYVQDYGIGLSKYEFETVFFKYFESTKDNTNSLNGCLGLGCKSLFGSSKRSGTVESVKNGKRYIYNLFIGSEGIPEYSLLLEEDSNLPNGVKVQIPVDFNEISYYQDEAETIYQYFEQTPKFIDLQIPVDNLHEQKDSLGNYCKPFANKAYAVMGNVAYPIEKDIKLKNYYQYLDSGFCYFFDIGEIDFTPSREELKYTDRTINALIKKFEAVKKTFVEKCENAIKNSKNEWEAILNYKKELNNAPTFVRLNTKFSFNGKMLETSDIDIPGARYYEYFYNRKRSLRETNKVAILNCNYVIDDLKVGAISRCIELYEETNQRVYLLTQEQYNKIPYTHDPNLFIKASTLPKPQRKHGSVVGKITELNGNSYYKTYCWNKINDPKDVKSKIYVIRDRFDVKYKGETILPSHVKNYIDAAGIKKPVYGISQKDEQEFIDLGWKKLEDIIDKILAKKVSKITPKLNFVNKYTSIKNVVNGNYKFYEKLDLILKNNKITSPKLVELLNLRKDFQKNEKTLEKLENNIYDINSSGGNIEITIDETLIDKYNNNIQHYPLFNHHIYDGDILYHYILGVDYANGNN